MIIPSKNSQKYIGINVTANSREFSAVDPKKLALSEKVTQKISNYIVNRHDKMSRVSVAYPCPALAQDAEMSMSDYEDFVFNACLQDWQKLGKEMDKILIN